MLKKFSIIVMLGMLGISIIACSKGENGMEIKKIPLITESELIKMASLEEKDYKEVDLNAFIAYSELKDENIKELLQAYEKEAKVNDVTYMFDDSSHNRKSDYLNGIKRIGFYMNINTSTKSILWDLVKNKKYFSKNSYIFSSLSSAEATPITKEEINQFLISLRDAKVFEWDSDTSGADELEDYQTFEFVVEYKDNTFFRVRFSGVLSEITPDNFDDVTPKLFSE